MTYNLTPIGYIQTPFKEKFGIPRQPGLAPDARGILTLSPPYNAPEAVRGLEAFTHLWLIFVFHETATQRWKSTVRPPRLGGNVRLGVFATRSMFRPNPIGLSVVRLESIEIAGGQTQLHLSDVDLLDQTPVLDIKPYLPYADRVPDASAGFAADAPAPSLLVEFTPEAAEQCAAYEATTYPKLRQLITQVLSLDPRPAYQAQRSEPNHYGMRMLDFDVQWIVEDRLVRVLALKILS